MVIPCEGTVNDAVTTTMTVSVTLRLFHLFVLAGKDIRRLGYSELTKFHYFDVCGIIFFEGDMKI